MAGDEDEIDSLEDEPMLDDYEAGSGRRVKRSAPPGVQRLFAEFVERSHGLSGPALERELDQLIDQIVERNVGIAPAGHQDELRATLRSYIEGDPTLSSMVSELRRASRR